MKFPYWNRFPPFLILFLVFPLLVQAEGNPQLPEDVFPALRQILLTARTQSPQMVAQNMNLMLADGDLQIAKAGRYPSINGFYQFAKSKDVRADIPGSLSTDKTYYNLTLTQPIYHWRERTNNAKIGEIQRQISQENYNEAYRLLAQEIRSGYMGMILGKINRKNAAYQKRLAEDALAVAEERLQKKVISAGAIFQTRLAADQARLNLETSEWTLEEAKLDFATLTGEPVIPDDQIPNAIPPLADATTRVNLLLTEFLSSADPDTLGSRIGRQQIQVSELLYKNQRTRLRPKLNFVAGISQDQQSYTTNIAQQYALESRYIGLQVTWNIFDGFATRGAISGALARKRLNEFNYKQFNARQAREAQKTARSIAMSQRHLAISERLLDNAKNGLVYAKENFERGQSAEADINNAQTNYNNLLSSTNHARYKYILLVAEFVSLIGEDSHSALARDN